MGMIEIQNITLQYGPIVVIKDLSITINKGDFFTLLGESGSGKSTLLMAIAGFLRPTAGKILIDSHDVTDLPPEQRDIGIVFQNYALFPNLTVFENVAFGLKVRKYPKQDIIQKTEQVLKTTGIFEYAKRKPNVLSGGQQQRVALARAMVLAPKILLLDEPLSNLDAKLRLEMRAELRRLQQQFAFTAVFVTHDQDEALSMSSQVALLNQGKIEQVSPPQDMYHNPQTPYTCTFLGEVCVFSQHTKNHMGLDTQAFVAIRPERLQRITDSCQKLEYTFKGTLSDIVFRGANALLDITLQNGENVSVVMWGHNTLSLRCGDTVQFGCNTDDLICIGDMK